MDRIFIDQTLLEEETFLYGIQMPGFMAMCLAGRDSTIVEFEGSDIKEEEMTNENLFMVNVKNKELLNKMANMKNWNMLIGITVDKVAGTSEDIVAELEKIVEEKDMLKTKYGDKVSEEKVRKTIKFMLVKGKGITDEYIVGEFLPENKEKVLQIIKELREKITDEK